MKQAMSNQRIFLVNLITLTCFLTLIIITQFFLAKKHLEFGFSIDIWNLLASYKQHVSNPILDMPKAWKEIGAHNFAHTYYVGILFQIFEFNYSYYNILHQLFKGLAAFSLFPVIYLLFQNKLLAFLATLLYATHFSTFGGLDDIARGVDFLVIISMNLFLTLYIWFSQHKSFTFRNLCILLTLLLLASFLDITRFYPVLLSLPLLELVNYYLNRSSTNIKGVFLRLAFFYAPFIAVSLFSPQSILKPIGYSKALGEMLKLGNFQLFLFPLASFGSMFIPPQLSTFLFGNGSLSALFPELKLSLQPF